MPVTIPSQVDSVGPGTRNLGHRALPEPAAVMEVVIGPMDGPRPREVFRRYGACDCAELPAPRSRLRLPVGGVGPRAHHISAAKPCVLRFWASTRRGRPTLAGGSLSCFGPDPLAVAGVAGSFREPLSR